MNDYLISHNRKPLGFINPMQYLLSNQRLESINDVKFGGNPGCGTAGFQANIGWDPVCAACTFSESSSLFS